MQTITITNNTITNIDFYDENCFKIIYDDFKLNIDEKQYNEHEKRFFHHFIKLHDEKKYNQFIIDFFYILKLYDEHKIKNDFFYDIYIINNIDFYDDITNAILLYVDVDISFDDISLLMTFDKNHVCDTLFNNIINNN